MKISIAEAAHRGINLVRQSNWVNALDHLKIDIINGQPGPWLHLYAPFNKACNGCDPVDFLWAFGPLKTDINSRDFDPYVGPLPDSEEYRSEAARFTEEHANG
jgi:hypothetical protein